MKKVIGYFSDSNQAAQAANELKARGFNDFSILGNEKGNTEDRNGMGNNGGDNNLTSGTMTGGIIGGLAGVGLGTGALGALGAAALLIPGVGPIVAMGPIAAALGGAVTGGIAGALIDYGIPKERSDYYESKIREGNTVIVLKTEDQKVDEVTRMLQNNNARDVLVQ